MIRNVGHYSACLTPRAHKAASSHLLHHYRARECQEDLCFALWRHSTGEIGTSALIDEVILPEEGERLLHGNASFNPSYLVRSLRKAKRENAGLVFMHSHPSNGWQGMSSDDIIAERDVIARPAGITGFPLVGMTIGTDEAWSARFWEKSKQSDIHQIRRCDRVKVVGEYFDITYDDTLAPIHIHAEKLRRTIDVWGDEAQQKLARLRFGVVGLGSVGSIVAESLARIGMSDITLIDYDKIERHNLDRTLYATCKDIGKLKVELAGHHIRKNATFDGINIKQIPSGIHTVDGYKAAVDCDILLACVDRPRARYALNHIAYAHLIPIIEGGIYSEYQQPATAHWKSHIIAPNHQCLLCNGQYNTHDLSMEESNAWDNPEYIANAPIRGGNQNVFAFSLNLASMQILHMLRYTLSTKGEKATYFAPASGKEFHFKSGRVTTTRNKTCRANCKFPKIIAHGDEANLNLIASPQIAEKRESRGANLFRKILSLFR